MRHYRSAQTHGACRKSISLYDQQNQLPEIKQIRPELKEVFAHVLRGPLTRLDKAFKAFFKGIRKYPRFKARRRYNSFTFPENEGFKIKDGKLRLSKIGDIKIIIDRPLEGHVKNLTITRTPTGKWFACFQVEVEPKPLPESSKAVGIDMGLKTFAALSDGTMIDNPRFFAQDAHDLARAQRKLSRLKKGTPEHKKARQVVARIYERIANKRRDFAHKLSRWLVDNYGIIVFEKLNIKGMIQHPKLSASISDAAWNLLITFTEYKAEEGGRLFTQVNPNGTSQMCSGCGVKVCKSLSVRVHSCPHCGLVIDRDLNAAINILRLGLQSLGISPESPSR